LNNRTLAQWAETIPPAVRELLGSPPLVLSESEAIYWGTVASFAELFKPEDPVSWLHLKDLADSRVEIARYRRLKSEIINEARRVEIAERGASLLNERDRFAGLLEMIREDPERQQIREKREAEERAAAEAANQEKMRSEEVATTERDLARLSGSWIEPVQQLDRLLIAAENRFTTNLEGLEHHRKHMAREVWENVIEGEIVDNVPTQRRNRRRGRFAKTWRPVGQSKLPRRKSPGEVA